MKGGSRVGFGGVGGAKHAVDIISYAVSLLLHL